MKPDTKAIRARADAATAGPWTHYGEDGEDAVVEALDEMGFVNREVCYALMDHDDEDEDGNGESRANLAFIAAARTDVPALCDRVEALERALNALSNHVGLDAQFDEWWDASGAEAALKGETP